ncbi:hypothetical protein HMF7854_00970 [Sphingomonas ginkgonis]|uniref:Transcriptional initiation protein Tat n=2 Tax=Sphingomonas ginkgonis TaxID=2315330 RepID=A0A429VDM9_9SPHN|nr:hypothetical protein HMF7854_00970 [Sphingomonas ginkgonis]
MLSSAATSGLPALAFRTVPDADPLAPLPSMAPVTPAPVVATTSTPLATPAPGGINPALFARAKAALDQHQVAARDWIGIADFSKVSSDPRFHLVNLMSGEVESFLVAHGRGSDPDHSGFVERFSNDFGSNATSSGAYTTADYYNGKYGLSLRVAGLDTSNNNAMARAIVIHNAWYAEPDMIASHGKLGRSEGCFAFGKASQDAVMRRLAGGRMIYADKIA